jgi:DNA end-binding protein Ku
VVLRDREQIVLLRPMGKVLAMTFLNYAEAVKDPAQFESEVLAVEVDPKELEVAKTLSESMTAEDFSFAEYPDKYKENVRRLIESKVKGQEVIAPPPEESPTAVINLMDALQESVAAAKKSAATRGSWHGAPRPGPSNSGGGRRRELCGADRLRLHHPRRFWATALSISCRMPDSAPTDRHER